MHHFRRLFHLWQSFYSRDFYREVVSAWKGIGLVYLILLLGLCWVPSATRWFLGLRTWGSTEAQVVVSQLPTIVIRDGVMSAIPGGRHVIQVEPASKTSGETLLIIDDTVDDVSSDIAVQAFVLTRREASAVRPARSERRVWALTSAADMELTPAEVGAFLSSLAFWVPPIGYAAAVAGSVVFRLLQALVYGAVARAYAARFEKLNLSYASAVRLAAVSVTPVIVIRTLLWFGPWEPAWYWRWPAALLITLGYLVFATRSVATTPSTASAYTNMS